MEETSPGSYSEHRNDLLSRLRRIEGQVRGIQRMVEADAYCVDVLTQLSAVVAACEKVGLRVLEDHIRGCVADAIRSPGSPEEGEAKIDELTRVLGRFLQTGRSPVSA
jgi:DNA-binding FrmR family transcriptional regulator